MVAAVTHNEVLNSMKQKNGFVWIVFTWLVILIASPRSVGDEITWVARASAAGGAAGKEWVISPPVAPVTGVKFTNLLNDLLATNKETQIRHIALGDVASRPDLQSEVMSRLEKTHLFQKAPPPFGMGKWNFKHSGDYQKLVADALLASDLVGKLNEGLAPHDKKITGVSMEKLFFTKDESGVHWHSAVWLLVTTTIHAKVEMYPVTPSDKVFFGQIKKAVLEDDVAWFSEAVSYPITLKTDKGTLKLANKKALEAQAALIFTEHFKTVVKNQSTNELFKNWQGVMIGRGDIWFSEVIEKTKSGEATVYRIIAINLPLEPPPKKSNAGRNGNTNSVPKSKSQEKTRPDLRR